MQVQVGPISSVGVVLWIAYARTVIGQALSHPGQFGVRLEPDVIEAFEEYLAQWEAIATSNTDFLWVTDVAPERVEFLGQAFYAIAQHLADAAGQRGYQISPPKEGDEFYRALVTSFLEALGSEGEGRLEASEQARDRWPGLKKE